MSVLKWRCASGAEIVATLASHPPMAPRLSKIERTELQDIIISKLQGKENIKDREIAKNTLHHSICWHLSETAAAAA